jgi:hypothetical protein
MIQHPDNTGRVIVVGMRQNDVCDFHLSVPALDMTDDLLARIGITAVDNMKPEGVCFAVLMRDDRSASGTEKIEIQANQFAAELTMPHSLLVEALGNQAMDIDDSQLVKKLALQFRMSEDAMRIRLSTLFFVR